MAYTTTQTRTNLITNPSFETNTATWSVVGAGTSISRITSDAYVGSACVQVNKGAVANGRLTQTATSGLRIPVTAGQPYYISAYVKVPSGQPSCSLRIRTSEYRADGTQNAAQVSATTVVSDTDGWVRLSFADTPTSGATPTETMIMAVEETTANARTYLVDACLFEQTATLQPYFDGSIADAYTNYTLTAQAWTGTANASTSVTHWGLTSTYVNNGVARFNNPFRDTQAFRQQVEVPNYSRRKVIYFASAFRYTQGFYGGVTTRTATGSGTGTQTAVPIRVKVRTATGSGTGTQTATKLRIAPRTATGSGTGTQTATSREILPRTATGSGQATASSIAVGVRIVLRTATGSGTGTQTATATSIRLYTANGSGTGSGTATRIVAAIRTATASGTGSQTVAFIRGLVRSATGSGSSSSSVSAIEILPRSATGSGQATTGSVAVGLRVVLRTASNSANGTGSVTFFVSLLRSGTGSGLGSASSIGARVVRKTATASGTGVSTALWVKLFIFYTPATTEIRAADRDDLSIAGRLFRYADPTYAGVNVYKLTDGTYTSVETRDPVLKTYWGGTKNFVTAEEKADLIAAGYGSYIT